jgi:hypothetical protein
VGADDPADLEELVVNDTLRIALIAIIAVAVFKFVAPKVPGLSQLSAFV